MSSLIHTPLERTLAGWWGGIDDAVKKAFFATLCVNAVAFGFEMTNLTLHHDDVVHIFIQDTILGHYLGRFGLGWFHYVAQNHYIMPFLQMLQGILMMSAYGILVARFWGARTATDLALMAAIVCVYPYMGQVYQYNSAMAPYPAAHLLAALAVVLSARATVGHVAAGALLYVAAFSIYQGVAANAATIVVVWLLSRHLFGGEDERLLSKATMRSTIAIVVSVLVGGAAYIAAVATMNLAPDTIHASDDAFHLRGAVDAPHTILEILRLTRASLVWPESYFPEYLKLLQLALIAAAAAFCVWRPKRLSGKLVAIALFALATLTPRALQLLHPKGHFHALTLTAYALFVAGALMIVNRAGRVAVRNLAVVATAFLLAGYVMQANWISTVNHLNMLAHLSTMTQVLTRVRALPDTQWDGKTIAVVGKYNMGSDYPFKGAAGVATEFMDPGHMQRIARLLRDEATIVEADRSMSKVLDYARTRPPWPHPASVGVVDGVGVVVLSKPGTD